MTEPTDVVIGELSEDSVFALVFIMGLILAVLVWAAIDQGLSFRIGAGMIVSAAVLVYGVRGPRRLRRAKGIGLYIRDGVLQDNLSGKSVGLEDIQRAYRDSLNGDLIKRYIILEISPKADNPAFQANAAGNVWTIGTGAYKTPASKILDRLQAEGVKVKGSKTGTFGALGMRRQLVPKVEDSGRCKG